MADLQIDIDYLLGRDMQFQKRSSALFLLKLKEFRKVSQAAIDDIVNECDDVYSYTVRHIHAGVREKLAVAGIDASKVEGLEEVFCDVRSPFEGLETQYLQEKYYCNNLGLVVIYIYTYI